MTTEEEEKLNRIEAKLDALLSVILVQQKDACEAAGVTPETVRNKVLRGEVEIFQSDGSRLNYLKLSDVPNLKRRSKSK